MTVRVETRRLVENTRTTRILFWCVVVVAIVVRVVFIATYPLNDRGGDTSNYGAMLLDGTSSLVHAGGYPFLIGLPFRTEVLLNAFGGLENLQIALLAVQHTIDLAALLVLHRVTRLVFGPTTAAIALLLASTNVQALSTTSAFYPEWFQSALLVAALGAMYFGFASVGFGRKLGFYTAGALAFTACMLVKFNAAVLAIAFVVAIAADRVSLKQKMLAAITCVGIGAATLTSYVAFHHYPSTGARALTYDTAWVLLTRMQQVFSNRLDPEAGPDTKRWLALNAVLPRSYEQAGPLLFRHVDAVPAGVREPYRNRFAYLLAAGPEQVEIVLRSTALPEGFVVGLSQIPVAYYIGLPESNTLGVRVALEAIRAHPSTYLKAVGRDAGRALRRWPTDAPLLTTDLSRIGADVEAQMRGGKVRLRQRPDFANVCCSYSRPVVWWPGVRLFSTLDKWTLGGSWPAILIGLAILIQVGRVLMLKTVDLQSGVALLLVLLIGVLLVASVATLEFRWKEARLVMPLTAVLAGSVIGWASSVLGRVRRA